MKHLDVYIGTYMLVIILLRQSILCNDAGDHFTSVNDFLLVYPNNYNLICEFKVLNRYFEHMHIDARPIGLLHRDRFYSLANDITSE